ncbi:alpha-glycosidase [Paenibacillus rhizovicinus]|uniref:Alpha-glycosidase n=1 Tax=Paenibacillus rhizovicinus TaxID=2704463 RepID=A0A6C0NYR6_9BACL|nr:alpha-glycosidase [Paenibacillus rhizovicinus]QHW31375.1 alpha-glycosidase [Paenibacillus rhizovicinus]
MFQECFQHAARSIWAYAYDMETIHLRVRTKRDDVEEVTVIAGDKYDWDRFNEERPLVKIAADRFYDYWEAAVKPKFSRFAYLFRLRQGDETVYLTEDGVCDNPPPPVAGYYDFPYIHEIDLFAAPEWAKSAVFYQIMPDRFANGDASLNPEGVQDWGETPAADSCFGGDLKGILDHLDHISELGATAIYLTPIFQAPSSHKYDTIDYKKIDEHFGDKEMLKQLVNACHSRGIRVVLDAVFNHTSERFPPFQDVLRNGEQSKYADWFHVRTFPAEVKDGIATYDTFGFYGQMPKLNTANPEAKQYLLDVAEYWIRETDIDGWRLDVAGEVDHHFWRAFRQTVKAAKPDAYIIGEVWNDARPWLLGDQFDSVMNYPFAGRALGFFAGEGADGRTFAEEINGLLMRYAQPTNEVVFNLLSSHDTPRVLTQAGGDKRKLKLMVVFLLTYIGTPCIFYGDEVGLQGENDPGCRCCMEWDEERQDRELFDFYKLLIGLRTSSPALLSGRFRFLHAEAGDARIVYERLGDAEHFTVWMNPTGEETVLEHAMETNDWHDALTGEHAPAEDGVQRVELEPYGYRILRREL